VRQATEEQIVAERSRDDRQTELNFELERASLPQNKRMKLISALKEIFSELDTAATVGTAATRSEEQCFAKV
jgi:hypothetical protein